MVGNIWVFQSQCSWLHDVDETEENCKYCSQSHTQRKKKESVEDSVLFLEK